MPLSQATFARLRNQRLGMEADELVRLKYVTGFAKLFENVEYKRAWMTRRQVKIRQEHKAKHPEANTL